MTGLRTISRTKAFCLLGMLQMACIGSWAQGSHLTIDECYKLAREHYPASRESEIIEKSTAFTVENAAKAWLPQITVNGQASYQSDVTRVPVSIPNMEIPSISKDQYRVYAELNQVVYDGGSIRHGKELQRASGMLQEEQLEVNLYALRERINQVFFGILLMDSKIRITLLARADLESAGRKMQAAVENGIALKSQADELKAGLLKTDQQVSELRYTRKAFVRMLSLFTGQQLSDSTVFQEPSVKILSGEIRRHELTVFEKQHLMLDLQKKIAVARNLPKLSLFAQGGYGRPVLNMLDNEFNTYYTGGIRFTWSLSGFYTFNKEKQLIGLQQQKSKLQQETFLHNTQLAAIGMEEETLKLRELVRMDEEITALRASIKRTAQSQLENGTITANEFLMQLDAEDQARQNMQLHKIQLLLAIYSFNVITGN